MLDRVGALKTGVGRVAGVLLRDLIVDLWEL
jgi:hypothetical protein